ncbi:hypothetical protein RJT34_13926 [Clitoria ternatea]|uniref:Leucine-rich repeat-containing N-terminal plant-type domain-containing protein n=1 Tax=Clitoria ternatea TaxID=43366 RepID=A0AAN9JPT3_CLITE
MLGYFVIPLLYLLVSITPSVVSTLCIEEERIALLKIRKDLKDPSNCFSWIGKDCCNWAGIQCDNQTGHVLMLDLNRYSRFFPITKEMFLCSRLSGEINPSLTGLKHLNHLDLSNNNFQGTPIPNFIGSLNMLSYLGLSNANFSGIVPTHLGNLSNLHFLDISSAPGLLWVGDISWISSLSSLQYLDMESVNISNKSHELFQGINMMPSLLELHLSNCNLGTLPLSFPFGNVTSLSVLVLSGNPFNSPTPSWLFNMPTLTQLELSFTSLRGFPPVLGRGNLCNLQTLHLSRNYNLTGDVAEILGALSSCKALESLDLRWNKLSGKLPYSLGRFKILNYLDLSNNLILGPLPASIGNLSNLRFLNLEGNKMNGKIPESIGQLSMLINLDLLQNYWEGTMTNIHFHNLTNLMGFSMSSKNNSFALKVTQEWVPPFKLLQHVEIRDCHVGPAFPIWLRNLSSLTDVILQNVGIYGDIPHWLFNMSSQIWQLDLSHNNISGYLPKKMNFSGSGLPYVEVDFSFNQLKGSIPLWSNVRVLTLGNNLLSGTVPTNIGDEMPYLQYLDLSSNHLNGSIPLSINMTYLNLVDLSNNHLTGEIPEFGRGMRELRIIDLSSNSLSGGIPTSIRSLRLLSILELSNNNLSADLSSAFQNFTGLKSLSLGNNRFFGSMPKEFTKNLPLLVELLLRGNTLIGSIPEEICHLPFLHILDLAENNLSGSIPACFGDAYGFKLPQTVFVYVLFSGPYNKHTELVMKGRMVEYWNKMLVHSCIDLSNNHFSGEIPEKLTELIHLGSLNLSWNRLTGDIPDNIGSLRDLESLDLSHNHRSGLIPQSMASLTFLSQLNLSYNNLSGQIPIANQFGTFPDPSIYAGNPKLCGVPLPTNCSSPLPKSGERKDGADDDKTERLWVEGSIAVGYITGFWLVCGSLVLKRRWRHAYFNFVFDKRDQLLVLVAVKLARARRRLGLESN